MPATPSGGPWGAGNAMCPEDVQPSAAGHSTAAVTDAASQRPDPAPRQLQVPWPDGQVTQTAVRPNNIYIQAGAFLRRDSATRMSLKLSRLARSQVTPAQVGQQHYFRVRLGPLASVEQADRLLDTLFAEGHTEARVVVE